MSSDNGTFVASNFPPGWTPNRAGAAEKFGLIRTDSNDARSVCASIDAVRPAAITTARMRVFIARDCRHRTQECSRDEIVDKIVDARQSGVGCEIDSIT